MGFFERMAGKSELRVQELMLSQIASTAKGMGWEAKYGPASLSCPFVIEEHNGLFVSGKVACIALLRCKGSWWGEMATDEEKKQFESGIEIAMYVRSSVAEPRNLGPVSQPMDALAFGILSAVTGR